MERWGYDMASHNRPEDGQVLDAIGASFYTFENIAYWWHCIEVPIGENL